jgi:hypothetical protein
MFVIAPKDLPLKTEELLEGLAGLPTTVSTCYSACVTEPREVVLLDTEITRQRTRSRLAATRVSLARTLKLGSLGLVCKFPMEGKFYLIEVSLTTCRLVKEELNVIRNIAIAKVLADTVYSLPICISLFHYPTCGFAVKPCYNSLCKNLD